MFDNCQEMKLNYILQPVKGGGIVVLYGVIVPGMICVSLAPLDLDAC